MAFKANLSLILAFVFTCQLISFSQNGSFLQQIKSLPIELRKEFIREKSLELFKLDSVKAKLELKRTLNGFTKNTIEHAYLLEAEANYYLEQKNYQYALTILQSVNMIYNALNDFESEMTVIQKVCDIYIKQNEANKAIQILFNKLKSVEGSDDKAFYILSKIGVSFKELKNYPKAMEYLLLAEDKMDRVSTQSEKFTVAKLSVLKNLGVLYREKNNFEKAFYYFNKGYALAEQSDNNKYKGIILNSLGILYKETKQFEKAILTYEESIQYKKLDKNLSGVSNTYSNLGELYLLLKNLRKAKENYWLSYNIAIESKSKKAIFDACQGLYQFYDYTGDINSGYPYLKRAYQLQDSIYSLNSAEESARLESIYNNEKKQKEIEISKIKNQNLERSIAAKNKERNLFVFSAIVLALLLMISVRSYLQKRKVNELLSINNKLVNDQKLLVEEKQKEILDSIQYAKKIQSSQLANDTYIAKTLDRLMKKNN